MANIFSSLFGKKKDEDEEEKKKKSSEPVFNPAVKGANAASFSKSKPNGSVNSAIRTGVSKIENKSREVLNAANDTRAGNSTGISTSSISSDKFREPRPTSNLWEQRKADRGIVNTEQNDFRNLKADAMNMSGKGGNGELINEGMINSKYMDTTARQTIRAHNALVQRSGRKQAGFGGSIDDPTDISATHVSAPKTFADKVSSGWKSAKPVYQEQMRVSDPITGKAPKGSKVGDSVYTNGGVFKIVGVNDDGSYVTDAEMNALAKAQEQLDAGKKLGKTEQESAYTALTVYMDTLYGKSGWKMDESGNPVATRGAIPLTDSATTREALNNKNEEYKRSTGSDLFKTTNAQLMAEGQYDAMSPEYNPQYKTSILDRLKGVGNAIAGDDEKRRKYDANISSTLISFTDLYDKAKKNDQSVGRENRGQVKYYTDDPTGSPEYARYVQYMTDKEKETYNYIWDTKGSAEADRFYDALKYKALEQRDFDATLDNIQLSDNAGIGEKTANSAYALGVNNTAGVVRGISNTVRGAKNLLDIGEYKPVTGTDSWDVITATGQKAQSTVAESIESDTLRELYQATMSIADSAISMAMGGALGKTVAGASKASALAKGASAAESAEKAGKLGANVAAKAMAVAFYGKTAQQTIVDSLQNGATQQQALMNGFVQGATEVLASYLPFSKFSENLFSVGGTGVKSIAKNAIKGFLGEAGEEGATQIVQSLTDIVLLGDRSNYAQSIEAYKAAGMTDKEAHDKVASDTFVWGTIEAAGIGGFSGAAFGAGTTALGTIAEGNSIRTDSAYAKILAETALRIGVSDKLESIATKVIAGADVSAWQLADLKGGVQESAAKKMSKEVESMANYLGISGPDRIALTFAKRYDKENFGIASKAFTKGANDKISQMRDRLNALEEQDNLDALEEFAEKANVLLASDYLADDARRNLSNFMLDYNREVLNEPSQPLGSSPRGIDLVSDESTEPKDTTVVADTSEASQSGTVDTKADSTYANYTVGKTTARRARYHRSAESVQTSDTVNRAKEVLAKKHSTIADDYDTVEEKKGSVVFNKYEDFDEATEPRLTRRVEVFKNGKVKMTEGNALNGRILPDKSEYVADDYQGFDVAKQRAREALWKKDGYDENQASTEAGFKRVYEPRIQSAAEQIDEQNEVAIPVEEAETTIAESVAETSETENITEPVEETVNEEQSEERAESVSEKAEQVEERTEQPEETEQKGNEETAEIPVKDTNTSDHLLSLEEANRVIATMGRNGKKAYNAGKGSGLKIQIATLYKEGRSLSGYMSENEMAESYSKALKKYGIKAIKSDAQILADAYVAGMKDIVYSNTKNPNAGLDRKSEGYSKASSRLTREQIDTIDALGRALGYSIQFVNQLSSNLDSDVNARVEGKYRVNGLNNDANRVIQIRADAEEPLLFLTIHETIHSLRTANPDAYNELSDFIRHQLTDKEFRNAVGASAKVYKNLDDTSLEEEVIANIMGSVLFDEKLCLDFAKSNKTILEKIIDVLAKILEKVTFKERRNKGNVRSASKAEQKAARVLEDRINELITRYQMALESTQLELKMREDLTAEALKDESEQYSKDYSLMHLNASMLELQREGYYEADDMDAFSADIAYQAWGDIKDKIDRVSKEKDEIWDEYKQASDESRQRAKPREEWNDFEEFWYDLIGEKPEIDTSVKDELYKKYKDTDERLEKLYESSNRYYGKYCRALGKIRGSKIHERTSDFSRPKEAEDVSAYEHFADSIWPGYRHEYEDQKSLEYHTLTSYVAEMSPLEYVARCAAMFNEISQDGKTSSLASVYISRAQYNEENVLGLMDKMRSGVKMDMPWLVVDQGVHYDATLNYTKTTDIHIGQEGLHRAIAAFNLGDEKIPVRYVYREDSAEGGIDPREEADAFKEILKPGTFNLENTETEQYSINGITSIEQPIVDLFEQSKDKNGKPRQNFTGKFIKDTLVKAGVEQDALDRMSVEQFINGRRMVPRAEVISYFKAFDQLDEKRQSAVDEYGANREGARVETPKETDAGKTMKHVDTIVQAPEVNESVVPEIVREILDGKFIYTPSDNAAGLARAKKTISEKGLEGAISAWEASILTGGIPSTDDVALGDQLIVEASKAGYTEETARLIGQMASIGNQLAQGLQALSIVKKAGGIGAKAYIDREIARLNAEVTDKDGNVKKDIKKLLDKAQKLDDENGVTRTKEMANEAHKKKVALEDLADAIEGLMKARKDLADAEKDLADVEKVLNEAIESAEETEEVKQKIRVLTKERNEMRDRITSLEWEAESYQAELETVQNDIDDLSLKKNVLNQELNKLTLKGKEKRKEAEILESEIGDIEGKIKTRKEYQKILTGHIERINKRAKDLREELDVYTLETSELMGDLRKQRETADTLEQQIADKEAEIKSAKERETLLAKEIKSLKKKLDSKDAKYSELKEKLKDLEEEQIWLSKDLEEKQNKLNADKALLDDAKKQVEALKREIKSAENKTKKSNEKTKELLERLKHLETEIIVKRNALEKAKGYYEMTKEVHREVKRHYARIIGRIKSARGTVSAADEFLQSFDPYAEVMAETDAAQEMNFTARASEALESLRDIAPDIGIADFDAYKATVLEQFADAERVLMDANANAEEVKTAKNKVRSISKQLVSSVVAKDTKNMEETVRLLDRAKNFGQEIADIVEGREATSPEQTKENKPLLSEELEKHLITLSGRTDLPSDEFERYKELLLEMARENEKAIERLDEERVRLRAVEKQMNQLKKAAAEKGYVEPPVYLMERLITETDPAEIERIQEMIISDIASQIKATWPEKLNAFRYLSMLANPRTHIRNFLGNSAMFFARNMRDVMSATIQDAVGLQDKNKSLKGMTAAMRREYKDFLDEEYNNMVKAIKGESEYDIRSALRDRQSIFNTKVLDTFYKFNSKALDAEDVVYLKRHYKSLLRNYLVANGVTPDMLREPTDEVNRILESAREYAISEAQKATFRNKNIVANGLNLLSKSHPAAHVAVEGLVPFKRTPLNILARGVEYSPLGFVTTTAAEVNNLIRKGKGLSAEYPASAMIDKLCANLTGTFITVVGMIAYSLGLIHTPGDDDNENRLYKLLGQQDYSINIFGKNYTVDWLSPATMPFFFGAEIVKAAEELEEDDMLTPGAYVQAMINAFSGMSAPMYEMSMLSSINEFFESVRNSGRYEDSPSDAIIAATQTLVWNYLSQIMGPTILGQINRSLNRYSLGTYTDDNSAMSGTMQYNVQKVLNKIPIIAGAARAIKDTPMYDMSPQIHSITDFIYSNTGAVYMDAWGRKTDQGKWYERIFRNLLSPSYSAPDQRRVDKVDSELLRLYESVGEDLADAIPKKLPHTITWVGSDKERHDKKLIRDEYEPLMQYFGQRCLMGFDQFMNTDMYKSMTDSQKAKALVDLRDMYKEEAYAKYINEYDPSSSYIKLQENTKTTYQNGEAINGVSAFEQIGWQAITGSAKDAATINAIKDLGLSAQTYASASEKVGAYEHSSVKGFYVLTNASDLGVEGEDASEVLAHLFNSGTDYTKEITGGDGKGKTRYEIFNTAAEHGVTPELLAEAYDKKGSGSTKADISTAVESVTDDADTQYWLKMVINPSINWDGVSPSRKKSSGKKSSTKKSSGKKSINYASLV